MDFEFGTYATGSPWGPDSGAAGFAAGAADSGTGAASAVAEECVWRWPDAGAGVSGAAATWARMATRRNREPVPRMRSPVRNRLAAMDTLPPATAPYRGGFYHGRGARRDGFLAPWYQRSIVSSRRSWA